MWVHRVCVHPATARLPREAQLAWKLAVFATAAIGSFIAGTLASIALRFSTPTVAELAFVFGPADYLALMVLVGLAGYAMRVYDFPIAPALLGMILGPMAETQLRRALAIGQGSPWALVESPLSATLLVLAIAVLLLPTLLRHLRPA